MLDQISTAVARAKTLIDRLTATRAANLDNLDAAITTRAASSTALSNATWTNARAVKLDNLDAAVSTVGKSPVYYAELITSNTTWNRPADIVNNLVLVTAIGGGGGAGLTDGGDGAWGGGSGEWCRRRYLTAGATVSIVIGAGGAGAGAAAGSDGTDTTVGAWTFTGGKGGAYSTKAPAVQPGALGGYVDTATPVVMPATPIGCDVGGSPGGGMGGGAPGLVLDQSGTGGVDGTQLGANMCGRGGIGYGAGGGVGATVSGGAGAAGAVLLEWWEWEAAS